MNPLRVGVVGTGWGELLIQSFNRVKGVQVTALCDIDLARLQVTAKRNEIANTYTDYRDLLAGELVDWVAISTPPEQHEAMFRDAIKAGKHVLCEKPIALSSQAASALLAASQLSSAIHAVDYETRLLPGHAYAKELIDEGYLGQLHRVDVALVMEHPWGVHGNWAADLERGGGVLMELGSLFIDILLWWFGPVKGALAGARTNFPSMRIGAGKNGGNGKSRTVTGDDAFWAVITFERGGEALVSFMTGARHDPGWTIGAHGQAGSLLLKSGQLWGMRDGDREMGLLPIPKRLELAPKPDDPLMWAMARLIERMAGAICGDRPSQPFPTLQDDVNVLQVVEAIRRSSECRAWVEVR